MMKKIRFGWLALVIAVIFALASACAPAAGAKKEMKEEKKMEEKKMEAAAPAALYTDADATLEDGTLVFEKDPAFTIDIPAAFKPKPKNQWGSGHILNMGKASPPFSVEVGIWMVGEDGMDADGKARCAGWGPALKSLGSKQVEVLSVEKIDTYDEFPAYACEIEWLWTDGSTVLTSIAHYIYKGDKVIGLTGTTMGDPEGLTAIYETVDLNP